ncbi:SH2 domain-containing protein [Strongyloides ratti]|uniref:SH2 domain-containing protein n=1 Tax=Strongyloides ratti TaxID=34506 RepID=A0A090MYT7_STRRB|nr:SH2 domain-containing protein [Strongyloides ratti]CEF67754.1 SH2 domain-containing protein [Strongyloides ratti]
MSSNIKNCKHHEYRIVDGYEVLGNVVSWPTKDTFQSKQHNQNEEEKKIEPDYANFDPIEKDEEDDNELQYNSYVGGRTQIEIEKYLKRNISFFFYHKMSKSSMLNDLKIHLHLYMAYKNMDGEIFHFRVKNLLSSGVYKNNYYYLVGPCGKGPKFDDLENLVNYYKMKTEKVRKEENEK